MKNLKNIFFLLIGVVLLIISFQNLTSIRIQMLFWETKIPLVILLPLVLLIGFAAGRLTRKNRS